MAVCFVPSAGVLRSAGEFVPLGTSCDNVNIFSCLLHATQEAPPSCLAVSADGRVTMLPLSPLFSSETLVRCWSHGTSPHCHEEHQLVRTGRNRRRNCPGFPRNSSPSSKHFLEGEGGEYVTAPPRNLLRHLYLMYIFFKI